jgi:cytochrome c
MSKSLRIAVLGIVVAAVAGGGAAIVATAQKSDKAPVKAAAAKPLGIGRAVTPEEIAGWDIDVRPDGKGLPAGHGTVKQGEALYLERCAACHGEFGESAGRWPILMGGADTLASHDPVKSVGSYWPCAVSDQRRALCHHGLRVLPQRSRPRSEFRAERDKLYIDQASQSAELHR